MSYDAPYVAPVKLNEDGTFSCYYCHMAFPRTSDYFHKTRRILDGLVCICKECAKAHTRRRTKSNRNRVLEGYGGAFPKCSCLGCHENRWEFLVIDHIGGGGNAHRKSLGIRSGQPFYDWLIKNNFPDGFRILCHNCNNSLGSYGYCPHQRESLKEVG